MPAWLPLPALVKPEEVRIFLEKATRVRPAGERVEALLFKRYQLTRPDLGRPLDIGQLQTRWIRAARNVEPISNTSRSLRCSHRV